MILIKNPLLARKNNHFFKMATTHFENGVITNEPLMVNPLKGVLFVKSIVRFDKKKMTVHK